MILNSFGVSTASKQSLNFSDKNMIDTMTKAIIVVVLVLIMVLGLHSYSYSRDMPLAFRRAMRPFYMAYSALFVLMLGFLIYFCTR